MLNDLSKSKEIRTIVLVAKFISTIFRPIYYPLLCWVILFTCTPLAIWPFKYKIIELAFMTVCTLAFPLLLTATWRKVRHIEKADMRKRHNRIIPYCIFIVCYTIYMYMMHQAHMNYILLSVIIVALLIQVVCTITCLFWKVSVHAAGAGAIIGALAAYGAVFYFNPLLWMSIAIIVAGLVGTSRMILRQHTLSQVLVGIGIGVLCGYFGIMRGYLFFI